MLNAHISLLRTLASIAELQSNRPIYFRVRAQNHIPHATFKPTILHAKSNGIHGRANSTILYRLQSILISRFLLNLRHAGAPAIANGKPMHEVRFSQFSMSVRLRIPTLRSIVGNMGEPLEHCGDQEDRDEGEEVRGESEAPGADDSDIAISGEDTGAGPSGVQRLEDGGVQEVRRYHPRQAVTRAVIIVPRLRV